LVRFTTDLTIEGDGHNQVWDQGAQHIMENVVEADERSKTIDRILDAATTALNMSNQ
jgi:hypothetical protein